MKSALAIFVKTPSLSPVKTRLGAGIGTQKAKDFYQLSLRAVQQSAQDVAAQTGTDIYWAVGEEEGMTDPLWRAFKTLYTGAGGLGERQHHVYSHLLRDYDRVLLIGADAPQISPALLQQAIKGLDKHDFVIGPANDGGYYLFGGRVSVQQSTWFNVAWSTSSTRTDLETGLSAQPLYLKPLTDVDTQGDLLQIKIEMPKHKNSAQKHLLAWIEDH